MERVLGSNNIAEVNESVDRNLSTCGGGDRPHFQKKRRSFDFSLLLLWRGRTSPYRGLSPD
jgi:hypothetical protein